MGKGNVLYDFNSLIGSSSLLLLAKERALKACKTSSPILLYGETGTGKELIIQAIHNNSERKNMPFVPQNCAAIPENLLEGILFGTSKGSFTDSQDSKGIFELADGGTLYLDELNSMPLKLQAKLLRVLQEGSIRRVGDLKVRRVDVRVIASLNEEPEKIVEEGRLRKDLYFRLNVVRIDLPPLRDRKEDILPLILHFISKYNNKFGACIEGIDREVLESFLMMKWPGNVRELENVIESVFNYKQSGMIGIKDIKHICCIHEVQKFIPLKVKLKETEESYIKEAMLIAGNNITKAAEILKVPRQTLQYKLKKIKMYNEKY